MCFESFYGGFKNNNNNSNIYSLDHLEKYRKVQQKQNDLSARRIGKAVFHLRHNKKNIYVHNDEPIQFSTKVATAQYKFEII